MDKKIRLPIRKLVEFILRSGDIDSRYTPRDSMYEGSRIHRVLQKNNSEKYDYISEIKLSADFVRNDLTYALEGRADGIFHIDCKTIIDEIKTTALPLTVISEDFNSTHWAQAKCYACIYARQNALSEISIQLTYCNINTYETKCFIKTFSLSALQEFLEMLIDQYAVWASLSAEWQALRDRTIQALQFPFPSYRKGQRALAVSVYRTIAAGKKLFAQAPTGTGKTISALFPAVKAMSEGRTSKIFYLTAKTITRQVAEEAFERMRLGGLRIKTLTLTSKDKICFCENRVCRPEYCRYAKGHFDRVNSAVLDIVESSDNITRGIIEEYAEKHTVCPFELSLDVSLWVDCVICDYNYVFDPRVYLRRFFAENGGDFVFLIDEAHNLVDRSREMFSSQLSKSQFYEIKKQFKGHSRTLDKILSAINKCMIEYRKKCADTGSFATSEKQTDFIALISDFAAVCELMLKENSALGENNDFLQLYFDVLNFTLISDLYDERFITLIDASYGDVAIRLFCLDPSYLLSEALKRGGSAVMYSATLTPLEYFREILGGNTGDKLLALDSPFDSRNLCLMAADRISTKFKFREQSAAEITRLIGSFVSRKTGNYIVYFPSYKYMTNIYNAFTEAYPHIHAVAQGTSMSEEEREQFLSAFEDNPENTLAAFCVLGGIFSEGIDLKGSRLIGSVIVSVGLPQLSVQQNIIKDYFNGKNGMGYEYAYMYPGMNKVLQAAGRVIRCETDIGAVLLIDERFSHPSYLSLFPKHWHGCRLIRDHKSLEAALDSFWADSILQEAKE
jgi:DNA excision repair protein ERCC-2